MADGNRNDTFKSQKNPLLTGAALNYPFENIASSALLVPQPHSDPTSMPSDTEVDNFLGQDSQQKPSSFSAVIRRPSPQHSSVASNLSPVHGNISPTNFLQNQPNNYFSTLISRPICSPVVTTYSSTAQENTVTHVPPGYVSPTTQFSNPIESDTSTPVHSDNSQQDNLTSLISDFSATNENINLDTAFKYFYNSSAPPSPSVSAFGASSVLQPVSTCPAGPTSYQNFCSPGGPSIFTPIAVSAVETTSVYKLVSSSLIETSSDCNTLKSTVEQPNSQLTINASSPFYQSASTPSSTYSSIDVNSPSSLTSVYNSDLSSIPVNRSTLYYSKQSDSTPSTSSFFHSVPSTSNDNNNINKSLPIVSPLPNFSSNLYQSGNATAPSLFVPPASGEGHNLIPAASSTVPPAAPPKGGTLPWNSTKTCNTYRLGNLKRPAYAPPPDLSVLATNSMAAIPDPVLPTQSPTTLFTPIHDEVDNRNSNVNSVFTNQTSPGTSGSLLLSPTSSNNVAGDLSTNPTLPTYQSPVSDRAATVLPSTSEPPSLPQGQMYRPPYHHWFFKKQIEGKVLWQPFSMTDSLKLEEAFTSPDISPDTKVPTDGGRYDVDVLRRQRIAVYWQEEPGEVRRCSWFVKGSLDSRYTPYEEKIATMLEEEYKIASTTNDWNRQVALADGEVIILHSANAIAHHLRSSSPDAWGNSPQMQQKPRVVKRGLDEFDIPDGEPETVDHILFLVHGIGKFCDLKFRPVTEVVDDFRSISLQLLQSHFRGACVMGTVNRVEVLPVSWHTALHTEEIDRKLQNITLGSIHRLRQFTNDTLLDILFYTSPVFCETIVQAVGNELNRLYKLFRTRNPQFNGGVSLGGHSLGSLILFDMLCNQKPDAPQTTSEVLQTDTQQTNSEAVESDSEKTETNEVEIKEIKKNQLNRGLSYVATGTDGTGQPFISYPQLDFHPKAFFALGSPIGMFVTVRGIDSLGEDFHLPTCPAFYNIFHPFDPVAYRVETLILPELVNVQPVLIPHHKGRKRMHLELKDTMAHVGAAIKQRLMESIQSTWNTVYQLAMFHKSEDIGQEVDKVLEDQIMKQQSSDNGDDACLQDNNLEDSNLELRVGDLNGGRRIDYVLQEAPLESFNEYIFALSSHVCYWESEDTMLMMLKEIYASTGITPDNQVPQQILPFDMNDKVDNPLPEMHQQYIPLTASSQPVGMDPTAPPSDSFAVGPPPTTGFRRN
ncbi:SEC23-interacting protein-like isoform X2 [Lycorma delicatula]|uniref:SEC23-interacting protein-like isoform X2 n=1 Tax=Lycorma delicatula TaxID=130591 RepID=UPI003F510E27